MARSDCMVDGWLTGRLTAQVQVAGNCLVDGRLTAKVDGSSFAKSLIHMAVDGIDGTSHARYACGVRVWCGGGRGVRAPALRGRDPHQFLQKVEWCEGFRCSLIRQLLPATVPELPATAGCAVNHEGVTHEIRNRHPAAG